MSSNGRAGFICSDRWRYMAFAETFRRKWLPRLHIHCERRVEADRAFVEIVDSYPTILIVSKRVSASAIVVQRAGRTLTECGCTIKVGPALGHTPAYALEAGENEVENELLRPWIDTAEIGDGNRRTKLLLDHRLGLRFPIQEQPVTPYDMVTAGLYGVVSLEHFNRLMLLWPRPFRSTQDSTARLRIHATRRCRVRRRR